MRKLLLRGPYVRIRSCQRRGLARRAIFPLPIGALMRYGRAMGAVTAAEMRAMEAIAAGSGWSESRLLNLAGQRLGHALAAFFPVPGTIVAYLGKGHNAGDALVAMRVLERDYGWQTAARAGFPLTDWAELTREKWQEARPADLLESLPDWREVRRPLVLLDGLVGLGACGPLREPLAALAREMAWLRQQAGARVAAVDLPSGVDPDTGALTAGAVTADVTFMIGAAKRGLLTATAAAATGALALVPVEPLTPPPGGDLELISPLSLTVGTSPRPFDFHKGLAGRVDILAGSAAYTGAAVLAASGALRGGAGLIVLHAPPAAAPVIAAKCPCEIIVRTCENPLELLDCKSAALVIGPGLGAMAGGLAAGLLELIGRTAVPTVLDADALNLLAQRGNLALLKENHVLTPHPGEFRRLAPDLADLPREVAARAFAARHPGTLLLKGCRTLVTRRGEALWCNATGNPAMATGGQGDLLAGVLGAQLAAGIPAVAAAALAAWLCGRAAELALANLTASEESLTPTDLLARLGGAFNDWRAGRR
ncbi:MAG: NAD(P)H-hydrate dehydratase [Verrucomicrobia bacterium]|nr:NAD(P)H-hydrate dehydratase [Verrucomicrobiota bacterium]